MGNDILISLYHNQTRQCMIKSKMTKITNAKESSKRKVVHQIAKSKTKTPKTNEKLLSKPWLDTGISSIENCG